MKKNKRIWSWALAGALAISNLSGVVAAPFTTIVAQAAIPASVEITASDEIVAGELFAIHAEWTPAIAEADSIQIVVSNAGTTSFAADQVLGTTDGAVEHLDITGLRSATPGTLKVVAKGKASGAGSYEPIEESEISIDIGEVAENTWTAVKTGTTDPYEDLTATVTLGKTASKSFDLVSSVAWATSEDAAKATLTIDDLTFTDSDATSNSTKSMIHNSVTIGTQKVEKVAGDDGWEYQVRYPITISIDATGSGIVKSGENPYKITFGENGAEFTIALTDKTGVDDVTAIGFAERDKTDAITTQVEDYVKTMEGFNYTLSIGGLVGKKVTTINGDVYIAKATAEEVVTQTQPAYYFKSDSTAAEFGAVEGIANGDFTITPTKPGKNTVTVSLVKVSKASADADPTEKTIATGKFSYSVVAIPDSIVIREDGENVNTVTLNAKKASTKLTTKVSSALYDVDEDVTWILPTDAKNYLTLTQSGNDATLTATGNKQGMTIFVASNADKEFLAAYNKLTTKDTASIMPLAESVNYAVEALTVNAEDQVITIAPDPDSVNILLEDNAAAFVTISNNDPDDMEFGLVPEAGKIALTATSADSKIAEAAIAEGNYDVIEITPIAAGDTTVNVTGEYIKVVDGKNTTVTVETSIKVKVIDPDSTAEKEAVEKAEKEAELAKEEAAIAEAAADKANADAAAAKKDADAAKKDADAAKEDAAAQKAAADKANADADAAKKDAEKANADADAAKKDADAAKAELAKVPKAQENVVAETGEKVDTYADGTAVLKEIPAEAIKNGSYTVPESVKVNGADVKVTKVASKAFYKNKKIKKITFGANIEEIGGSACNGASKLKVIRIKGKDVIIRRNAFKKINKKAKIIVADKETKKNVETKGGQPKSVKVKKGK